MSNRHSLRKKGHNYSDEGVYFITICTEDRVSLFGEIIGDRMHLNDAGRMVERELQNIPMRFPTTELDAHIIMPNHVHVILVGGAPLVGALADGTRRESNRIPEPTATRAGTRPAPPTIHGPTTIGEIVGAFKSLTTNAYIRGVREEGWTGFHEKIWQRNYHDQIITNIASFEEMREYIWDNPKNWKDDSMYR